MSPQGKKGNPAAPAPADRETRRKRVVALVLAVFVIGALVIAAAAQGLGDPSVPDGGVATVEDAPDGEITAEDFESSLEQTAARQGLPEVPPTDDPQYELLADAAVSDLILSRWVLGEAEERGIEVTDREIDEALETAKQQQFGSEKAFQKFLDQSGFTLDEARERISLGLISDRIQEAVLPEDAEPDKITDEDIAAYYEGDREQFEQDVTNYYDENQVQFEQPESRDVRVVLTKTEEEANQAKAALEQDPSPKGFERVAKKFSIDEATKSTGGLREAVVAGQSEPFLDEQIFAAPEGELVGPFETDAGWYVIQVDGVTPSETTPLEDVREQIGLTLLSARGQELALTFQEDFQSKWVARTFCAEDYRIDRCSNAAPPPDPCTEEVAKTQGCDAPVASTRPLAPGTAVVFGAPPPQGLPQGPIVPAPATPPGGIPPGLAPLPGGAAPPGAAPPGAVPPGTPPSVPPGG